MANQSKTQAMKSCKDIAGKIAKLYNNGYITSKQFIDGLELTNKMRERINKVGQIPKRFR